MSKAFVDTAAWIALINVNDTLHIQAQQVKKQLRLEKATLLTTEFVFLEVADGLCMPAIRAKTATFIAQLRLLKSLQIITLNQTLLEDGWSLYGQRSDKAWSLTDCISFVVMYKESHTPSPLTTTLSKQGLSSCCSKLVETARAIAPPSFLRAIASSLQVLPVIALHPDNQKAIATATA